MSADIIPFGADPLARAKAEAASIRARLKELRIGHGWSTQDLASQIGVSAAYVERIEAGEAAPSLELACLMAALLKHRLADLVPGSILAGS